MARCLILFLSVLILSCSNSLRNEGVDSFEIEFKDEYLSYSSKSGKIKKLINPFKDPIVFADTLLFLSEKELGHLKGLYTGYNIQHYPDTLYDISASSMNFYKNRKIKFSFNGNNKIVVFNKNGSIESIRLHKIVDELLSIIGSSSEFKSLPQEQYRLL